MWSAGVILYILLSGQPPFEGEDVYAQVRKGHYALPHDRWHAISPAAKHMLSQMMMVDPQRRITVGAALRHPWMRCEDLSPAELAELEGPTAGGRGLGGLPASVVDGQHRALAVDDIEESWCAARCSAPLRALCNCGSCARGLRTLLGPHCCSLLFPCPSLFLFAP